MGTILHGEAGEGLTDNIWVKSWGKWENEPLDYLEDDWSLQKEQKVQRLWGKSMLGVSEHQGGQGDLGGMRQ